MKRWNPQMMALLLALLTILPACSAYMALQQPDKKNLDLLRVGVSRSLLIAEFGSPVHSETKNGKKTEIFKFTQGYGKGIRAGRAVFHTVADAVTLGLWEAAGIPIEAVLSGDEMAFQVTYDADDNIEEIVTLKR